MSSDVFERGDHAELAAAVLRAIGTGPITYDAGEFWRYSASRGLWELLPGHFVRHTAAGFAGSAVGFGKEAKPLRVGIGDVRGAEAMARDALLSAPDRVRFRGAPLGASFSNGFLTVNDGQIALVPHAPEQRARHGYPFEYVPWKVSTTPRLCEFLDALFADCSEDERADRIALLQEFAGICLVGDATRFQKCLILYGEGGNGKSALITLFRALYPPETLCSVAPQKWSERFGVAALEGKRANFVSETPSGEILDGGIFKAVITGDSVTGERKNRDPFDFAPIAGHIFSTNWPITTSDYSPGFWRRPIMLPFSRRFDLSPERRLAPEAEVIAYELPGVVAWTIEGAARAQTLGGYTVPNQSLTLAREWRDGSDQVRLFLSTRTDTSVLQAGAFYDAYREWARENGHTKLVTSHTFGRRVMASGLYERVQTSSARFYKRKVDAALGF